MKRTHQCDADCVEKPGVKLDYGGFESDNSSSTRCYKTCSYVLNHEHTHLKHNATHTEPPNASIIQTQSYSARFSWFFFYHIFLLLGCSPGSNSARLENFTRVFSFALSPSPHQGVSLEPTHLTRAMIFYIYVPVLFIDK